jgi:TatD DNase family protein
LGDFAHLSSFIDRFLNSKMLHYDESSVALNVRAFNATAIPSVAPPSVASEPEPVHNENNQQTSINKSWPLIDIGSNLMDPMFLGIYNDKQKHEADLSLVLERAHKNGVESIIITAGNESDAAKAQDFIARYQQTTPVKLFTTVGVHPTNALEMDNNVSDHLEKLRALLHSDSVVAVGEFGLDYDRLQYAPKDVQMRAFEAQIILAEESGKPLFLHSRAAEPDMSQVLQRHRHRFSQGVVHSFDGTCEEMETLLALGLYIGVNGCSLRTEENLEVVKRIPLDRLMLETDAPWCEMRPTHASYQHIKTMLPMKKKPDKFEWGEGVKGRCEPWMMRQVLEVVAAVKGLEEEVVAKHAYENVMKVFKL